MGRMECQSFFPREPFMKRMLGISLLAGALLAVPLLASARHKDVRDGRDTQGLLDVKRVEVSGKKMKPRFKIINREGWSKDGLWDRGYFLVYFDTRGDERFDYYALIRSNGLRIEGTVFRDRQAKPDYRVASVDAWKPSARSVVVRVPLHKLRLGAKRISYRWYAITLFTGDKCGDVCIDRAPDEGSVEERLIPEPDPAPPDPSVTPAPDPSPTNDPPVPPGGGGPPGQEPDPSPTP